MLFWYNIKFCNTLGDFIKSSLELSFKIPLLALPNIGFEKAGYFISIEFQYVLGTFILLSSQNLKNLALF